MVKWLRAQPEILKKTKNCRDLKNRIGTETIRIFGRGRNCEKSGIFLNNFLYENFYFSTIFLKLPKN